MEPIKVAVYLYPGADALDFTGPIEIFSTPSPSSGPPPFEVTTFAHHSPVATATPALVCIPNATFAATAARIQDYDVLVIPGAYAEAITALTDTAEGNELVALLQQFAATPPRSATRKRVLQSVCSGSVLVAASGILPNRRVTTHHWAFDMLRAAADKAAGGQSNLHLVQDARWVDSGLTDAGVRIVNAAGVSSGIDASLWVVGHLAGEAQRSWAAETAEFEPRDAAWRAGA